MVHHNEKKQIIQNLLNVLCSYNISETRKLKTVTMLKAYSEYMIMIKMELLV